MIRRRTNSVVVRSQRRRRRRRRQRTTNTTRQMRRCNQAVCRPPAGGGGAVEAGDAQRDCERAPHAPEGVGKRGCSTERDTRTKLWKKRSGERDRERARKKNDVDGLSLSPLFFSLTFFLFFFSSFCKTERENKSSFPSPRSSLSRAPVFFFVFCIKMVRISNCRAPRRECRTLATRNAKRNQNNEETCGRKKSERATILLATSKEKSAFFLPCCVFFCTRRLVSYRLLGTFFAIPLLLIDQTHQRDYLDIAHRVFHGVRGALAT